MPNDTEYKIVPKNGTKIDNRKLFRSQKFYLLCHGGCVFLMYASFAYLNATISTLEKRFHIPTRNSGFIVSGFDTASILAPFLGYFIAKRHRPKWLALIIFIMVIYCFQNALLHLYYGPGNDALQLTREYGGVYVNSTHLSTNSRDNLLCHADEIDEPEDSIHYSDDLFPQIYLFANQIFGGIFGAVHDSIGLSYMDDNIPKIKMPIYVSVLTACKVVAPLLGFNLATVTLSQYIAPHLTPIIDEHDNRWLGAWWMGWIVLGGIMLILPGFIWRFPKVLLKETTNNLKLFKNRDTKRTTMASTFNRILRNKIYMFNIISTVGSFLGSLPYWIYTAKYIEVQYKISAAESSFLFGTIVQSAAALGTLLAGYAVYKIKPSARKLVIYNFVIALFSAMMLFSYTLFDCSTTETTMTTCIPDCNCTSVKYNPICGDDGNTYVSPCHAGCTDTNYYNSNGTIHFTNCTCIKTTGIAYPGQCTVDCSKSLNNFLLVMSTNSFVSATSKPHIFLFALRAVDTDDKAVALTTMITILSYFAFIPTPIIYGWIIDQTCIFWDNSNDDSGNCWRYDEDAFRFYFNITAIFFLLFGALFGDGGLWVNTKNLKLFDDDNLEEDKSIEDIML